MLFSAYMYTFLFGIYIEIEWLDHMIDILLALEATIDIFQSGYTILQPPSRGGEFPLFTPSPTLSSKRLPFCDCIF